MSKKCGEDNRGTRFTALVVAFVFTATSVTWNTPAIAAPAEAAAPVFSSIGTLTIPAEMGTISKTYPWERGTGNAERDSPRSDRTVILIQDAHAVVDAQENIAKILEHLRKIYGVNLTALEGAKSPLEPILLRTFPVASVKKSVMSGYEKRAELSGPEMAAIFGIGPEKFQGMEEWGLYEQNYSAYIRAQGKKSSLLARWNVFKQTLDSERAKVYSPQLNEFQAIRENFLNERASLLDLLVYFSSFQSLLKTSSGYQELPGLIASIGYEKSGQQDALVPLVRKIADEFKVKYLRGLGVKTEMNFYNRYQAFLTGQITAGQMLQYLVQLGREHGKIVKLTPALKKLLGHTELLSEIKGSQLYDELQRFLLDLESSLIKTPAEREISGKYQKLFLLKEMIELELTHESLAKYQKEPDAYLGLLADSVFKQDLVPALEFYQAALARDHAFMGKIDEMMKVEKQKTVAVVAGGFHTNGLERILKEQGVAYAVVTPKIASLEGIDNYAKVMKGDVSFKEYLKTTYFDGLMRHSAKALAEALPFTERVQKLKLWRDDVIRDLAKQGRITDAGKYLPYIDEQLRMTGEVASVNPKRTKEEILDIVKKELEKFKKDSFERIWKTFEFQLSLFIDGLKQLIVKKNLNAQAVSDLLSRAATAQPSFLAAPLSLQEGVRILTVVAQTPDLSGITGKLATPEKILAAVEPYAMPKANTPESALIAKTAADLVQHGFKSEAILKAGEARQAPDAALKEPVENMLDELAALTPNQTRAAVAARLAAEMAEMIRTKRDVSAPAEIPGESAKRSESRELSPDSFNLPTQKFENLEEKKKPGPIAHEKEWAIETVPENIKASNEKRIFEFVNELSDSADFKVLLFISLNAFVNDYHGGKASVSRIDSNLDQSNYPESVIRIRMASNQEPYTVTLGALERMLGTVSLLVDKDKRVLKTERLLLISPESDRDFVLNWKLSYIEAVAQSHPGKVGLGGAMGQPSFIGIPYGKRLDGKQGYLVRLGLNDFDLTPIEMVLARKTIFLGELGDLFSRASIALSNFDEWLEDEDVETLLQKLKNEASYLSIQLQIENQRSVEELILRSRLDASVVGKTKAQELEVVLNGQWREARDFFEKLLAFISAKGNEQIKKFVFQAESQGLQYSMPAIVAELKELEEKQAQVMDLSVEAQESDARPGTPIKGSPMPSVKSGARAETRQELQGEDSVNPLAHLSQRNLLTTRSDAELLRANESFRGGRKGKIGGYEYNLSVMTMEDDLSKKGIGALFGRGRRNILDWWLGQVDHAFKQAQSERPELKKKDFLILELGPGDGFLARQLAAKGYRVIGMDFTKAFVMSSAQSNPYPDRLQFVRGDATNLDGYDGFTGIPDSSVDLIISNEWLGNVPIFEEQAREKGEREKREVKPVFKEFFRKLKVGGLYILNDLEETKGANDVGVTIRNDVGYLNYSIADRKAAMQTAGFQDIREAKIETALPKDYGVPFTHALIASKGVRSEIRSESRVQEFESDMNELYTWLDIAGLPSTKGNIAQVFNLMKTGGRLPEGMAQDSKPLQEWMDSMSERYSDIFQELEVTDEPAYSDLVFTPEGEAVLILGASMSGKSSLASAFQNARFGYGLGGESDTHYLTLHLPGHCLFAGAAGRLETIRARALSNEPDLDDRRVKVENFQSAIGLIKTVVNLKWQEHYGYKHRVAESEIYDLSPIEAFQELLGESDTRVDESIQVLNVIHGYTDIEGYLKLAGDLAQKIASYSPTAYTGSGRAGDVRSELRGEDAQTDGDATTKRMMPEDDATQKLMVPEGARDANAVLEQRVEKAIGYGKNFTIPMAAAIVNSSKKIAKEDHRGNLDGVVKARLAVAERQGLTDPSERELAKAFKDNGRLEGKDSPSLTFADQDIDGLQKELYHAIANGELAVELKKNGVFQKAYPFQGRDGVEKNYEQVVMGIVADAADPEQSGNFRVMHAPGVLVPDIMAHLGRLWKTIHDQKQDMKKRKEALAAYEWWFFQCNPYSRGGASLGDAMSMIAQIALGIPMRDKYVHQDLIALSSTMENYVNQRVKEFGASGNQPEVETPRQQVRSESRVVPDSESPNDETTLKRQTLESLYKQRQQIENDEIGDIVSIGDQHGNKKVLENILEEAEEALRDGKESHITIHGDAFDRGYENARNWEILRRLKEIAEESVRKSKEDPDQKGPKITVDFILGNHDVMMMQAMLLDGQEAKDAQENWFLNGGKKTMTQLLRNGSEELALWVLQNFKLFSKDERGFLHVHAFPPFDEQGHPLFTGQGMEEMQKELEEIQREVAAWMKKTATETKEQDSRISREEAPQPNVEVSDETQPLKKIRKKEILNSGIRERLSRFFEKTFDMYTDENYRYKHFIERLPNGKIQVDAKKIDRFLEVLGAQGIVFAHYHFWRLGVMDDEHRLMCIDAQGDPGHLIFNKEGIQYQALNGSPRANPENLPAVLWERISESLAAWLPKKAPGPRTDSVASKSAVLLAINDWISREETALRKGSASSEDIVSASETGKRSESREVKGDAERKMPATIDVGSRVRSATRGQAEPFSVSWEEGVRVVEGEPALDGSEIQWVGTPTGHFTVMQEAKYQGKTYFAKRMEDKDSFERNDLEKDHILPQAEILAYLKETGVTGIPNAEHFIVTAEGVRMILFEKFPMGASLEAKVIAGTMSQAQLLQIVLQVARIVEQLHKAGVYHWDIKPENIWVGDNGEVIVYDFDAAFRMKKESLERDTSKFLGRGLAYFGSPMYVTADRFAVMTEAQDVSTFTLGMSFAQHEAYGVAMSLLCPLVDPLEKYPRHNRIEYVNSLLGGLDAMPEVSKKIKKVLRRAVANGQSGYKTVAELRSDLEKAIHGRTFLQSLFGRPRSEMRGWDGLSPVSWKTDVVAVRATNEDLAELTKENKLVVDGSVIYLVGEPRPGFTMTQEVAYQGKTYFAKYVVEKRAPFERETLELDYIWPQAKILIGLRDAGVTGIPQIAHTIVTSGTVIPGNLRMNNPEKVRMLLLEKFPAGTSLDLKITSGTLSKDQLLRIIAQAAGVVERLNDAGVYHWDIKPGNIWIADDWVGDGRANDEGKIILFDFDSAFRTSAEFSSRNLSSFGADRFMTAARHQKSRVFGRDIVLEPFARHEAYSVAMSLLLMLVDGQALPPWQKDTFDIYPNKVLEVLDGMPGISEKIKTVLRRAVADGKSGYETVADFRRDLEAVLKDSSASPEQALLSQPRAEMRTGLKSSIRRFLLSAALSVSLLGSIVAQAGQKNWGDVVNSIEQRLANEGFLKVTDGDTNAKVAAIQGMLKRNGFYNLSTDKLDGLWGSRTAAEYNRFRAQIADKQAAKKEVKPAVVPSEKVAVRRSIAPATLAGPAGLMWPEKPSKMLQAGVLENTIQRLVNSGKDRKAILLKALGTEVENKKLSLEQRIRNISEIAKAMIPKLYPDLSADDQAAMHDLLLFIGAIETTDYVSEIQRNRKGPVLIGVGSFQNELNTLEDIFLNYGILLSASPKSTAAKNKWRFASALAYFLELGEARDLKKLSIEASAAGPNVLGALIANAVVSADGKVDVLVSLGKMERARLGLPQGKSFATYTSQGLEGFRDFHNAKWGPKVKPSLERAKNAYDKVSPYFWKPSSPSGIQPKTQGKDQPRSEMREAEHMELSLRTVSAAFLGFLGSVLGLFVAKKSVPQLSVEELAQEELISQNNDNVLGGSQVLRGFEWFPQRLYDLTGMRLLAQFPGVYSPMADGGMSVEVADINMEEVSRAAKQFKKENKTLHILVIGAGTGFDAFAAYHHAREQGAEVAVTASELQPEAFGNIQYNLELAKKLGKGDLVVSIKPVLATKQDSLDELQGKFDLILWNTPDVKDDQSNEITRIVPEVFKKLMAEIPGKLAPGGTALIRASSDALSRKLLSKGWTLARENEAGFVRPNQSSWEVWKYSNPSVRSEARGAADGENAPQSELVVERALKTWLNHYRERLQATELPEGVLLPTLDLAYQMVRDGILPFIKPGSRVLEIGTGTGVVLAMLAEASQGIPDVRFEGTDINPQAVRVSKQMLQDFGNVAVREGDLFDPVAGEKFDVVFWNPPWFPGEWSEADRGLDKRDDGHEVLLKFLGGAKDHLTPAGRIFLLFPTKYFEAIKDQISFYITELDSYQSGERLKLSLYELSAVSPTQRARFSEDPKKKRNDKSAGMRNEREDFEKGGERKQTLRDKRPSVTKADAVEAMRSVEESVSDMLTRSELRLTENPLLVLPGVEASRIVQMAQDQNPNSVRSELRSRAAVEQTKIEKKFDDRIDQLRQELNKYSTAREVVAFINSSDFQKLLRDLFGEFGDTTALLSQMRNRVVFGEEYLRSERLADNASQLNIAKTARDQALLDAVAAGLVMNGKEPSFSLLMDRPGDTIAEEVLGMLKMLKPSLLYIYNGPGEKPFGHAWGDGLCPIVPLGKVNAVRRAVKASRELIVSFWSKDRKMGDLGIYSILAEVGRIADPRLRELALTAVRVALLRFATFDKDVQKKILADPSLIQSYLEQFGIASFIQFDSRGLVFNMEKLVEEYTARRSVEKAA